MTTIDEGQSLVTLVNVFDVNPAKADELVALLNEATEGVMRDLPGFVSANIHKSLDGSRVINYAQWRSKEDFEAMRSNSRAGPHMKAAAELAEKFDPTLCEVVAVHSA